MEEKAKVVVYASAGWRRVGGEAIRVLEEGRFAVRRCSRWEAFHCETEGVRCAVMLLGTENAVELAGRLGEAERPPPLIAVRRRNAPLPVSTAARFHAQILPSEITPHLMRVVVHALVQDLFQALRDAVTASRVLTDEPRMRWAVLEALGGDEPLPSVHALAGAAGCSRRYLQVCWARAAEHLRADTGALLPAPKAFCRAVLLMWALRIRFGRRGLPPTWRSIADRLGVTPKTLRQLVNDLTGVTPSELRLEDVPELLIDLEQEAFRALLGREEGTES